MPDLFWIGLAIAATFVVLGAIIGARSRSSTFAGGAAMGAYLGIMSAFPLLALGLSTA
jgi:hypothetical protein